MRRIEGNQPLKRPKTFYGPAFVPGKGMRRIIIAVRNKVTIRDILEEYGIILKNSDVQDEWKELRDVAEVGLTQRNLERPFVRSEDLPLRDANSGRTRTSGVVSIYEMIPPPIEMPPPEAGFKPYWELKIIVRHISSIYMEAVKLALPPGWAISGTGHGDVVFFEATRQINGLVADANAIKLLEEAGNALKDKGFIVTREKLSRIVYDVLRASVVA